jgi:hypothetical protein
MFRKTVTAVLLAMAVLLAAAPAHAASLAPPKPGWVALVWARLAPVLNFFKGDCGLSTDPNGSPTCAATERGLSTDPDGQAAGEEGERGLMIDPNGHS